MGQAWSRIAQDDWKNAAMSAADDLSNVCLTLGDLAQAGRYAKQGVELADRSGSIPERADHDADVGFRAASVGHLRMKLKPVP